MKDRIQLKALAKINLGLDVLRRREDGYHEVKMIMQTISLHDDLEIRRMKTPEIQVKTNLYYLPTNENNLVYKAAKLLMDEFGYQRRSGNPAEETDSGCGRHGRRQLRTAQQCCGESIRCTDWDFPCRR